MYYCPNLSILVFHDDKFSGNSGLEMLTGMGNSITDFTRKLNYKKYATVLVHFFAIVE